MTPRHATDDEQDSPAPAESSHTRWVVTLVSVALVGLLAFFAKTAADNVTTQIGDHGSRIMALEIRSAAAQESERRIEETQGRLEATQLRLEQKVDRLLEQGRGGNR